MSYQLFNFVYTKKYIKKNIYKTIKIKLNKSGEIKYTQTRL